MLWDGWGRGGGRSNRVQKIAHVTMKWRGCVARFGWLRSAYRILVGELKQWAIWETKFVAAEQCLEWL